MKYDQMQINAKNGDYVFRGTINKVTFDRIELDESEAYFLYLVQNHGFEIATSFFKKEIKAGKLERVLLLNIYSDNNIEGSSKNPDETLQNARKHVAKLKKHHIEVFLINPYPMDCLFPIDIYLGILTFVINLPLNPNIIVFFKVILSSVKHPLDIILSSTFIPSPLKLDNILF